jgi:hypothetical protein
VYSDKWAHPVPQHTRPYLVGVSMVASALMALFGYHIVRFCTGARVFAN